MDYFIGEEGGWGSTVTGDLLEMQLLRPRLDLQNQNLHFHKIARSVAGLLKCGSAAAEHFGPSGEKQEAREGGKMVE